MSDKLDYPDPLTPPDCDLRGMPYMPLDLVRLFDSDFYAISTGDEFKAGLTLWGRSFLQVPAGSLPDDDRVLAHLSGTGLRWSKLRTAAMHGWVKCSDGRLYHPVVAQKAVEAWGKRSAFRERTRNATEARRLRREQRGDDVTDNVTLNVTTNVTSTKGESKGKGEGTSKKERTPLPPKGDEREIDPEFETFWQAYPRRDDRGHAERAWRIARKSVSAAEIMAGLAAYRFKPEREYQPLASTWLTGRRWADEVLPLAPVLGAINGAARTYDRRYFTPNTPAQVFSLPRPQIGSVEDHAWCQARDDWETDPPAGMTPR